MKRIMTALLRFFARMILKKYHPLVVGITGSVGKTSSKDAIFAVLSSKFSVRASYKNYNNELGVPLTIIGAKAPGSSPFKWIGVFVRAKQLLLFPIRYPAILVLEMGADRPKDIAKLVALAPPSIAVVTAVSPAHTEFFGSIKRVAQEKRRLVEAVPKEGTIILNVDDEIVSGFESYAEGHVIKYGIEQEADVRAVEITERLEEHGGDELGGVRCKILLDGSVVPIHLRNVLGHQHIYAALAACAVGRALGMNMVEISNALLTYSPPPGRMRLIAGIKKAFLIDDTYNSSPRAALAALAALATLGRLSLGSGVTKYAVLGDMLELGNLNEISHREVGRAASEHVDVIIAVGVHAALIVEEAVKNGMSKDRVFHFHNLEDGVEHFLQERMQPGDVLLIKGSQAMRMEKLVKGLMAEPLRAKELLCRQDAGWLT